MTVRLPDPPNIERRRQPLRSRQQLHAASWLPSDAEPQHVRGDVFRTSRGTHILSAEATRELLRQNLQRVRALP